MIKINEIIKATKGRLVRGEVSDKPFEISIDSRTIKKGQVFVAVRGKNFDGHKFVYDAIKRGASGVVASKKIMWTPDVFKGKKAPEIPIVKVNDSNKALGDIAGFYRRKFNIPVIAITGSVGKTTTKEMIANVLSVKHNVLKSMKTENNMFGVSLTLLRLREKHRFVVLELGTNHFGEIETLAKIARPTVAVFTNIGESHLQYLKTTAGVFKEKVSLIKHMDKKGVVVFNQDDEFLATLSKKKMQQKKVSFSVINKSKYQAEKVKQVGSKLTFQVNNNKYTTKTCVEHNVYNALAAICCGNINKISSNSIRLGLCKSLSVSGRQKILRVEGMTIIDDTYNSNPISFESAIRTLEGFRISGRRIIVCSDMLELGTHSKELHEKMARVIEGSGIDIVLTIGNQARFISTKLKKSEEVNAIHYKDAEALKRRLKTLCKKGDAVLIKGSRSTRMERFVDFIAKL